MNTVAIKAQQTLHTNSRVIQDTVFSLVETAWKQIRKLAWLFENTSSYSDRLLRDKDLGPEYRRMRW